MFTFNTTEDIPAVPGTIGQEKALNALDFGLSMDSTGFNIFALGESGWKDDYHNDDTQGKSFKRNGSEGLVLCL